MAGRAREQAAVDGGEGGGHTGAVPTGVLVPQVIDAVDLPVIAAGGIVDGRGLAGALAWGAAGSADRQSWTSRVWRPLVK